MAQNQGRQDIHNELREMLLDEDGTTSGSAWTRTLIDGALNKALSSITAIIRDSAEHVLRTSTTLTMVAGQYDYVLPINFWRHARLYDGANINTEIIIHADYDKMMDDQYGTAIRMLDYRGEQRWHLSFYPFGSIPYSTMVMDYIRAVPRLAATDDGMIQFTVVSGTGPFVVGNAVRGVSSPTTMGTMTVVDHIDDDLTAGGIGYLRFKAIGTSSHDFSAETQVYDGGTFIVNVNSSYDIGNAPHELPAGIDHILLWEAYCNCLRQQNLLTQGSEMHRRELMTELRQMYNTPTRAIRTPRRVASYNQTVGPIGNAKG